jgi:hypothetical protein
MRMLVLIGLAAMVVQCASTTNPADLPYRFEFPTQYTIKVLVNPCRFSDNKTSCCSESYGAMECVSGCSARGGLGGVKVARWREIRKTCWGRGTFFLSS